MLQHETRPSHGGGQVKVEDSKLTLLGWTLEVGRTPSLLLMCALYF